MKTSEAAEALSVSPTTLRAWEARHGFPLPARTLGHHRIYDRSEILALRRALEQGLSIASAIEKVRANLGIDDTQLVAELRAFQGEGADAAMEAALSVRPLDRCVEEVLLPSLRTVAERAGRRGAAWAFAAAWARDWLRRQTRLSPAASRTPGLVLLDATVDELDPDRPALFALELHLARAGVPVRVLPVAASVGVADALGTAGPLGAVVVAGDGAEEVAVDRWLAAAHPALGQAALLAFRASRRGAALPEAPWEAHRAALVHLSRRTPGARAFGSAR
jgi:MerR family transcriptional regulator, light-induced transcriptional regulator